MTADIYDSILGLIQQGTGNNNNTWGSTFNTSFAAMAARAIGGAATRSNAGGSLDLSGSPPPAGPRQDIDAIQIFNGTLTSDLTVTVPNNSKLWWFQNSTSGAFNLYVKTPSGTATQVPQGVGLWLMCDGNNNVVRHDKQEVGSIRLSAKSAIGPGELVCDGSSLLRAKYPDLFAAIGTLWGSVDSVHFTLPLTTDTGRYIRGAIPSVLNAGNYQSNQNAAHTHTMTGAPAVGTLTTDNPGNHTHANSLNDLSHTHNWGPAGFQANVAATGAAGNTPQYGNASLPGGSNNSAPMSITNAAAGAHTHNVTGTLTAGTLATASSGGTEARPETIVLNLVIRY